MVESLNVESARYSMMVVLGSNFSSKASATIPPIESESIVSPVENTYFEIRRSVAFVVVRLWRCRNLWCMCVRQQVVFGQVYDQFF